MSTFEAMTRKRKSQKKVKMSLTVGQHTVDAIHRLFEQEPSKTASQIVADCVQFAETLEIYKPVRRYENDIRVELGKEPKPMGVGRLGSIEDKKIWASLYGAETDGINMKFMKYEVTPTGAVVRNQQVVPIKSLPSQQDEFRKVILGKFATLNQAESAFETQSEKADLAPIKMLGKRS